MEGSITSSLVVTAQRSAQKILNTISTGLRITCGVVPIALIFAINPFLSNEKYNKTPDENTMHLLMTAVPGCLFLFQFASYFNSASFLEGKCNLQGGSISARQSIIIVFSNFCYHVNTFLSVIAYPLVTKLANFVMEWDTFVFYNLHIVSVTLNVFFSVWVSNYLGIGTITTQTVRNKSKLLDSSMIRFKKNGIMKKMSKQNKNKFRKIKMSFKFGIPYLMISIFMFFFTGGTRYFLQQSKVYLGIYCLSILLLKVCIQIIIRTLILKMEATSTEFYTYVCILGCTVLIDCPIRFIFSQIDSSSNFILVTSAVAVSEIILRCVSIYLVIKTTRNSAKESYHYSATRKKLIDKKKSKIFVSLIMHEVEADMASEFVAINSSYILNIFFGHYVGFLVGKATKLNIYKQTSYLVAQYVIETLVDFVAFALESHHPLIKETLADRVLPSRLGLVSTNILLGVYCMLVLVLLMVY